MTSRAFQLSSGFVSATRECTRSGIGSVARFVHPAMSRPYEAFDKASPQRRAEIVRRVALMNGIVALIPVAALVPTQLPTIGKAALAAYWFAAPFLGAAGFDLARYQGDVRRLVLSLLALAWWMLTLQVTVSGF